LEDWCFFEINRTFDVADDGRASARAPEVQPVVAAIFDDLEIVGGVTPALALPIAGNAARTQRIRAPFFDYNAIDRPCRGNYCESAG
jgi:hypothetical protein